MDKRNLLAVFLLVLLFRGGVLLITPDALVTDPDGYRRLAENLIHHDTFGAGPRPTAYRPPLYPLMLSGCVALGDNYQRLAIGVLHSLLGAATAAIVYLLARRWGLSIRAAVAAAALVALDPILLNQSAQIMTETAAAFFTAAGLLALSLISVQKQIVVQASRLHCAAGTAAPQNPQPSAVKYYLGQGVWPAMFSGIIFGLGALCRPTLLLWTAAAGAVLFICCYKNSRRLTASGGIAVFSRIRLPAAFFLGAILVLAPWAIRNQVQFGRPIVTTTHGGYTLLLANNPSFYQWLREGRWGSVWPAEEFNAAWIARRPKNELAADRLAYDEARRAIAAEPGMFGWACLVRVGRFWSPLAHQVVEQESPARKAARWSVAAWYVLVFLLAIIGLWKIFIPQPASPQFIHGGINVLLLLACLTAVHAVYWTDMRMRAVVMPAVALLSAAGIALGKPAGNGTKPNIWRTVFRRRNSLTPGPSPASGRGENV